MGLRILSDRQIPPQSRCRHSRENRKPPQEQLSGGHEIGEGVERGESCKIGGDHSVAAEYQQKKKHQARSPAGAHVLEIALCQDQKTDSQRSGGKKREQAPLEREPIHPRNHQQSQPGIAVKLRDQPAGSEQQAKERGRGRQFARGHDAHDRRERKQKEIANQVWCSRVSDEERGVDESRIVEPGENNHLRGVLRHVAHGREGRDPDRQHGNQSHNGHQSVSAVLAVSRRAHCDGIPAQEKRSVLQNTRGAAASVAAWERRLPRPSHRAAAGCCACPHP
jgi:hypothetical protein